MSAVVRIGEYDILDELGRGGFGVVYRARKRSLPDREVALKEVPLGDTEKERERRRREARALLRIQSVHIVALHDVFEVPERGTLCLVMELLNTQNFRRRLHEQGRIGLDATVVLLDGVLDALVAAHGATDSSGRPQPIVHRDLKPENIGFQAWRGGELVKVMDFGIARFTDPDARVGRPATTHAYTPAYAAPEVLVGQAAVPASDLWAVGLIAWESLVGRHPLVDEHGEIDNPRQRLVVNQGTIPELPAEVRARAQSPLVALIRNLCAHDPSGRPSAAEARSIVASLRGAAPAVSPEAPIAPSGTHLEPPKRPTAAATVPTARPGRATPASVRPWRAVLAIAGAVAALAIVALVGVLGLSSRGAPTPLGVPAPVAPGAVAQSTPPSPSECPELAYADPELAALSPAQLEARVRSSAFVPPSVAESQLAALRSLVTRQPPERRDCVYRHFLNQQILALRQMGTSWEGSHTSEELAALFRTLPLREPWTLEQRNDILEQVEQEVLPTIGQQSDRGFYRRSYYSAILRCNVTDQVLIEQLRAPRPDVCISFRPRR